MTHPEFFRSKSSASVSLRFAVIRPESMPSAKMTRYNATRQELFPTTPFLARCGHLARLVQMRTRIMNCCKLAILQGQSARQELLDSGKPLKTPPDLSVPKRDAERQAKLRALLAEGKVRHRPGHYFGHGSSEHSEASENLAAWHKNIAVASVGSTVVGVAEWL